MRAGRVVGARLLTQLVSLPPQGLKVDFAGHDNSHHDNVYLYPQMCGYLSEYHPHALDGHQASFFNNVCAMTNDPSFYIMGQTCNYTQPAGEWTEVPGRLLPGNDDGQGTRWTTLDDAKNSCGGGHSWCIGFTYNTSAHTRSAGDFPPLNEPLVLEPTSDATLGLRFGLCTNQANYTFMVGFLAAGNDVHNGPYTYADAVAYCDSSDDCGEPRFPHCPPVAARRGRRHPSRASAAGGLNRAHRALAQRPVAALPRFWRAQLQQPRAAAAPQWHALPRVLLENDLGGAGPAGALEAGCRVPRARGRAACTHGQVCACAWCACMLAPACACAHLALAQLVEVGQEVWEGCKRGAVTRAL